MWSEEYKSIREEISISDLSNADNLSDLLDFIKVFPQILDELPDDYLLIVISNKNLRVRDKLLLIIVLTLKLQYEKTAAELMDYLILLYQSSSDQEIEDIDQASIFLYLYFFEMLEHKNIGHTQDEFFMQQIIGEEKLQQEFKFTSIQENQPYPDEFEPDQVINNLQVWLDEVSAECAAYFNKYLQMAKFNFPEFSSETLLRLFYLVGEADKQFISTSFSVFEYMEDKYRRGSVAWISSLCKIVLHFEDGLTDENLQVLEDNMTASRATIRIPTTLCMWRIADDMKLIRSALDSASSKKEKNIFKRVLDDPDKEKKRFVYDPEGSVTSIREKLNSQSVPEVINDEDTVYLFKFRRRRKLAAIKGNHTLSQLHSIIMGYFDLEPMHLYGFYMDNNTSSRQPPFSHPYGDGPSAEDVTISELNLYLGQKFLLIHDYGANHRIHLEFLDTINPEDIEVDLPTIISKTKI